MVDGTIRDTVCSDCASITVQDGYDAWVTIDLGEPYWISTIVFLNKQLSYSSSYQINRYYGVSFDTVDDPSACIYLNDLDICFTEISSSDSQTNNYLSIADINDS